MVRIYPIIHPRDVINNLFTVRKIISAGVKMIQLRGENIRELLESAKIMASEVSTSGTTLILNNRVDAALAANTGVHLGQTDFPFKDARKILGDYSVIGLSTHNKEEALRCAKEKPDYISIGPIFPTSSKSDAAPVVGTELLREIIEFLRERLDERDIPPIVAVGGINSENFKMCLSAGSKYVAVISSIRDDMTGTLREDVEELIAKFA